jgi:RNA polymerase sigma-70 factor, ECF subfamily
MDLNFVKKFQDQQQYNRLKKQEAQAFSDLYDKYSSDLYRFVFYKVGREEEAQDLTSLVFLKAWQHIGKHSISETKTLRALIYKIARNAIIDHYREGRDKIESLDNDDKPIVILNEDLDLEEEMDTQISLEKIQKHLHNLKEEYRELIVLRYINELEIEEISVVTGKSKGSIRVSLHRALQALKDKLK